MTDSLSFHPVFAEKVIRVFIFSISLMVPNIRFSHKQFIVSLGEICMIRWIGYGFMVVASACFLFTSATILFFLIRCFFRIINNIYEDQRNIQKEILQLQKDQIVLLEKIRDTVGATLVVAQNANVP